MMKTKADGYFVMVKNKVGYPSDWACLKITRSNFSQSWFGGGNITRVAVFTKWQIAYDFGRRETNRLNKKFKGDFDMVVQSIRIFEDYK